MYPSTPLRLSGQDPGCGGGNSHGYTIGKSLDSYLTKSISGTLQSCAYGWGYNEKSGNCHPYMPENGPPLNVCNAGDRVFYYVKDDISGYSLPHQCSMLPLYARVFDVDQLNYYMKLKNKTVAQMTDQHANPIDYNEQYDDPQLKGVKTTLGQHCSDEIQFWNVRYLGTPGGDGCVYVPVFTTATTCDMSRSQCRNLLINTLTAMNLRSVDAKGAGGWRDYGALS